MMLRAQTHSHLVGLQRSGIFNQPRIELHLQQRLALLPLGSKQPCHGISRGKGTLKLGQAQLLPSLRPGVAHEFWQNCRNTEHQVGWYVLQQGLPSAHVLQGISRPHLHSGQGMKGYWAVRGVAVTPSAAVSQAHASAVAQQTSTPLTAVSTRPQQHSSSV